MDDRAAGGAAAADAQASMIPEDLKPEEYDRLRELVTLKVLWEALDAARKKVDVVIWLAERGYEGDGAGNQGRSVAVISRPR